MRKRQFDRLLASTVLALTVVAPTLSVAAPDRVESARPLPPSLNGQTPRHREAAPMPPPALPAATAPEPRAQAPAEPRGSDTGSNFNIKSALDKLLAASDAQITDKLRRSSTPSSSRSASTTRPSARRSRPSMPRADTRRCGSAMERSPRRLNR
ncbi:MAG TPA: hypothetical protein VII24_00200 [Pseudolabrys sp.]